MDRVKRFTIFITGTDTGVGKTVLADALTRQLRHLAIPAVALKPVCSGGRDDARRLRAAAGGALTLDEVNPWHFRAALSPLLAARREDRRVTRAHLVDHVRRIQARFPLVLVEGAGGLLSPLGEDFDSRDLILALRATPIVVSPNRLGALNQIRLVLGALPCGLSRKTQVVLMSLKHPDAASRSNPRLLGDLLGGQRVHVLPRLKPAKPVPRTRADRRAGTTIRSLIRSLGLRVPPPR